MKYGILNVEFNDSIRSDEEYSFYWVQMECWDEQQRPHPSVRIEIPVAKSAVENISDLRKISYRTAEAILQQCLAAVKESEFHDS